MGFAYKVWLQSKCLYKLIQREYFCTTRRALVNYLKPTILCCSETIRVNLKLLSRTFFSFQLVSIIPTKTLTTDGLSGFQKGRVERARWHASGCQCLRESACVLTTAPCRRRLHDRVKYPTDPTTTTHYPIVGQIFPFSSPHCVTLAAPKNFLTHCRHTMIYHSSRTELIVSRHARQRCLYYRPWCVFRVG